MPVLLAFLEHLRDALPAIIWQLVDHLNRVSRPSLASNPLLHCCNTTRYDAVTIDGRLEWQNQLNSSNAPFYLKAHAIFTNYTWKEEYVTNSALYSKQLGRQPSKRVIFGTDCFGRGTFGGGGFQVTPNLAQSVELVGQIQPFRQAQSCSFVLFFFQLSFCFTLLGGKRGLLF